MRLAARRTSPATPRSQGWPAAMMLEVVSVRVLVTYRNSRERRRNGVLGFPLSGGGCFYRLRGRRPSSRALERRRWIGCLGALHRAASCPR
jgi:hypothetical protein